MFAALAVGLIESAEAFPLLINDRFGIGIMLAYVWKEIPFITLMLLSVLRSTLRGRGLAEVINNKIEGFSATAEVTGARDDPVAGNQDRDRIGAVGRADAEATEGRQG